MFKPLVYISSPFSKGDQFANVHFAFRITRDLIELNDCIPICPLTNAMLHLVEPATHDFWMRYDLDILSKCDILYLVDVELNLSGVDHNLRYEQFYSESMGCQEEKEFASDNQILIATDPGMLQKHIKTLRSLHDLT